jgi:hypothetical protein
VAGLAVGLLATGQVAAADVLRRAKVLRVTAGERREIALVDVAVTRDRFVGARALWRIEDLSHVLLTFADPHGVGLSAVAAQLSPTTRTDAHGIALELGEAPGARHVLAPIAPGLVRRVAVRETRRLAPGDPVRLVPGQGAVALDGEREIATGPDTEVEVVLDLAGPLVLDVTGTLGIAAREGLLNGNGTGRGA